MTLLALYALLPFSVGQASGANGSTDPLVRYRAFARAHPNIEVAVEAQANGRPGPRGVVLMQRGKRTSYRGEWDGVKATVTSTESGYLDLENTNHLYDELPVMGNGRIVRSRMHPLAETGVPPVLFVDDLARMLPTGAKFKVASADGIDTLTVSVNSPVGEYSLEIRIDAEGKPTYFRSATKGPEGELTRVFSLSNYRFPANLGPKNFSLSIPLGYMPHSLPFDGYQLQQGEAAPLKGWKSPSGEITDFSGKGRMLLAVIDADSGPGEAAAKMLGKFKSTLPLVIVGSLPGAYTDPDGSRMAKLHVTFTPTIFLIDAKGKVEQIFMGFDRDEPEVLEKDIRSVLNPEPPKKPGSAKG